MRRATMERIDIYLYVWMQTNKDKMKNARMDIFELETKNPKLVYSDMFEMIPSSMEADVNGEFPVVYINKPYTIRIYDKCGYEILTRHVGKDS